MGARLIEAFEATRVPFANARALASEFEATLSSEDMVRAPHDELEALCHGQGLEWARRMLDEHLRLRGELERHVPVVGADGVERGSPRDSSRRLKTVLASCSGAAIVARESFSR